MSNSRNLKAVLLGKKSSGKTCFFNRLIYDEFGPTSMSISAYCGVYPFQESQIQCDLWDLSGNKMFDDFTNSYCREANYVFILVDSTQELNKQEIDFYIEKAQTNADAECHISIILTKADSIHKIVTIDDVKQLYPNTTYSLGEVSSQNDTSSKGNIADLFDSCLTPENPVQEQIQNPDPVVENLDQLKKDIHFELNKYIKNSFSVLFSRHHHNSRAKAVRNAINEARSLAEIKSILSSQINLINAVNSNSEQADNTLDERWKTKNKQVNAFSKNSGFILAILNSDKVLDTFQEARNQNRL
ncbi:MAG: ADP-ribosylation factor-like protein [Gammaproteobacteria bacterium]|nr:ADP-ribosylation factor-like protein [Gammaproteobacteria bacterium]